MEHIVQFGISIDDKAIENIVTNKAAEFVINQIKERLGITSKYYSETKVVNALVEKEVKNLFQELKPEIINETARIMADKMFRSKAFRDGVITKLGINNEEVTE